MLGSQLCLQLVQNTQSTKHDMYDASCFIISVWKDSGYGYKGSSKRLEVSV